MRSYCLKIASHYSGQVCGHFPDLPGLVIMGRDPEEVAVLAEQALEAELERLLRKTGQVPRARASGPVTISTSKF
jgi:predicted RNase H-like HicB family nuclease